MTAVELTPADGQAVDLRGLFAETDKCLQLLWRRRATLLMSVVTLGLIYLMIEFFVGGGRLDDGVIASTLPGLVAYTLASIAALQGAGGVAEEINGGTMEQIQLSSVPALLLVLGRVSVLALEGLVPAALLAVAFWAGFGLHYTVSPGVLVPLLLTVLDAMAYGLLMVALTTAMSSIGALTHVFNMMVMFFGGMFVPVTTFPHGVQIFARVIPTTLGVQAMNASLAGASLGTSWSNGILPWLLVHIAIAAGLGTTAYAVIIHQARRGSGLRPR